MCSSDLETPFDTAVRVAECRRHLDGEGLDPPPSPASAHDAIALPRADEHTVGQVVALVRLAARLESLAG